LGRIIWIESRIHSGDPRWVITIVIALGPINSAIGLLILCAGYVSRHHAWGASNCPSCDQAPNAERGHRRTAATDHQGGISSRLVKLPSCSKAHYIVKLPSSNAAQGGITAAMQLRISSLQRALGDRMQSNQFPGWFWPWFARQIMISFRKAHRI
jgi:hypothetical protein